MSGNNYSHIGAPIGLNIPPSVQRREAEQDDKIKKLRAALRQIRQSEGRVCSQYEDCQHRACQSSYNSWAIADRALQDG